MNDIAERLESKYKHLEKAQVNYYLSEKTASEAKAHLDHLKVVETAAGMIVGKNATEREASAREHLGIAYQFTKDAQEKAGGDKIRLTIAQLEVDLARALIRIEEIEIGRLPNAGH